MSKPLLQIALDQTSLAEALEVAAVAAPHVDIIEAGTILCLRKAKPPSKPCARDTRSTSSSPITKPPMPVQHLPTSPLPPAPTGSP